MSDPRHDHHVNFEAANELKSQVRRAEDILEQIAVDLAATEPNRPAHERALVERKHVLQAAELFFGSMTRPPSSAAHCDVFISHSSRNKQLVHGLHDDLKRRRVSCFVADLSIRTASKWVEELWSTLAACRVVAIVLTPQSVQSVWCTAESGAAIVMNKTVVPILCRVSRAKLPAHLKQFQAITVNNSEQRKRLVDLLVDLCR